MAWILNYQPTIKDQHIHMGDGSAEVKQAANAACEKPRKKNVTKSKAQKHPKVREIMTFKRKSSVTDAHLIILFAQLAHDGWIEGDEVKFKALFSGKLDKNCELTWCGKYGKGTLVGLFKQLVDEGLVIVPDGYTISAILEGHFKDIDGKWLTGLDKGDKANNKALPQIQAYKQLMSASIESLRDGSYANDDDDLRYDSYDHQDMKYHKK